MATLTLDIGPTVAAALADQAAGSGRSVAEQVVADRIAALMAAGNVNAAVDLASRQVAEQHAEVNAVLAQRP
jgi:hypothetical protein